MNRAESMAQMACLWNDGHAIKDIATILGISSEAVAARASRDREMFPRRRRKKGERKVKYTYIYVRVDKEGEEIRALATLRKKWKCSRTEAVKRALVKALE